MTAHTGFTRHDYTTVRGADAPVRDVATGSHEGRQYTASAEAGAPLHLGARSSRRSPRLTYNNLDQDGYTEQSSNGMALNRREPAERQRRLGLAYVRPFRSPPLPF